MRIIAHSMLSANWMVWMRGVVPYLTIHRRCLGLMIAPLILLAIAPTIARAQHLPESMIETKIENQQDRDDAALGTSPGGALTSEKDFTASDGTPDGSVKFGFAALAPIYFNSNAEGAEHGGTQTLEGDPDLRLSWKKFFASGIVFSGFVDTEADRYVRSSGADGDAATARLRLQLISGMNDQEYQPFMQYKPSVSLQPTFSGPTTTVHQFSAGFDKAFDYDLNFDRIGVPLPVAHSDSATVWSFGFTGYVARSIVESGTSSYSVFIGPSVTWNITNLPNADSANADWNASLEVDTIGKFYDGTTGNARRDWSVSPILTIEYDPPLSWWPGALEKSRDEFYASIGRPAFQFQIAFTRDELNKPGASFSQWAIGPVVKTAWKF